MTLQQLRYLLGVADHGLNITNAANHLYTSQPGVSKQLRLLEEELGVQLFVRNGRSLVATTTAGIQVIAHARLIMREVDGIRSFAKDLRHEEGALDGTAVASRHAVRGMAAKPLTDRRVAVIRKRPF